MISPALVTSSAGIATYQIGKTVAEQHKYPESILDLLLARYREASEDGRSHCVLNGFLAGLQVRRPDLADRFLDQAISDEDLAPVFPEIQCDLILTVQAIQRLHRAISIGRAPPVGFLRLASNDTMKIFQPTDLDRLFRQLLRLQHGLRKDNGQPAIPRCITAPFIRI